MPGKAFDILFQRHLILPKIATIARKVLVPDCVLKLIKVTAMRDKTNW